MTDLVERLRAIDKDIILRRFDPEMSFDGMTAHEAADRIEKDAQHIDEMYALVAAMNADHTASKTRIEKLEAVIKDDALWLAAYHLWCAMKGCAPSSSDLIAARKILEGKDERSLAGPEDAQRAERMD